MTHGFRTLAGLRSRLCRYLVFMLFVTVAAGLPSPAVPQPAAAKAAITRTTPADGELLSRWPRALAISFSEQIVTDSSTFRLVDSSGANIPGIEVAFSPDGTTMSIEPPSGLDNGTFSMIWEARSPVDGNVIHGYSAFTVGTAADGSVVTVPSTGGPPGGPAQWLETLSSWSALLGLTALVAIWPAWTLIIRPAVGPIWRQAGTLVHQITLFTLCAVALALLGSIFEMVVQAQNLLGGTAIDKIMNTIGQYPLGVCLDCPHHAHHPASGAAGRGRVVVHTASTHRAISRLAARARAAIHRQHRIARLG